MPAKKKLPPYKTPSKWLVIAPVLLTPAGLYIPGHWGGIVRLGGGILLLAVPVIVIWLYVKQAQYLRQIKEKKRLRYQAYLLGTAVAAPGVALIAGDLAGASTYGTPANIWGDMSSFLFWLALALVFAYGFIIGNEVYFKTRGRTYWWTGAGNVFIGLAYIAIAAVSWIVCSVTYSLHDPSTE